MNVYFWKMACEKAKSFDVDKVREAWKGGLEFDAPSGKVKLDPENQHVYRPFMIGKIKKDKQFEIIDKSDGLVKPDPYPQFAFKGWSCDWTQGRRREGRARSRSLDSRPRTTLVDLSLRGPVPWATKRVNSISQRSGGPQCLGCAFTALSLRMSA